MPRTGPLAAWGPRRQWVRHLYHLWSSPWATGCPGDMTAGFPQVSGQKERQTEDSSAQHGSTVFYNLLSEQHSTT